MNGQINPKSMNGKHKKHTKANHYSPLLFQTPPHGIYVETGENPNHTQGKQ